MDLIDAMVMARHLMARHIDPWIYGEWDFEWMNSTRRSAEMEYGTRTIRLSRFFTRHATSEQVKKSILHEIAHVHTPEWVKDAHGPEWKSAARALGIEDPQATCERPTESFKWLAICPGCGKKDGMDRLSKPAREGKYGCTECMEANPGRRQDFILCYVQQH
jgi:predicted SprT family Zn-dependent metalloprotease